jgi:hypothetical protein
MFRIGVMHMSDLKQHMYQHLRSAKEWLTKAEDAFDKQHDVRAELDLMLAQAELQHVKEANRSQQWRYKYAVFRHGVALTLAVFMAVAAGGVYWWTTKPELAVPVPLVGQTSLPAEKATNIVVNTVPNKIPAENNLPVQQAANQLVTPLPSKAEQVRQPQQPHQQPETAVIVSSDEMQKLVRAAGKSLRGQ